MNKKSNFVFLLLLMVFSLTLCLIVVLTRPFLIDRNKELLSYCESSLCEDILSKVNTNISIGMKDDKEDDESNFSLIPLILKLSVNIDITNPKTFIASQIPLLRAMKITSEDTYVQLDRTPCPTVNIPEPHNTSIPSPLPKKTVLPIKTAISIKKGPAIILPVKKYDYKKPLILIYHTHTSEMYGNLKDVPSLNYSTANLQNGVCHAGEIIKNELMKKYGISAIHDTTIHSFKLEGAYDRSRLTVAKYLKKYPSLKIVLDLHRDSNLPRSSTVALLDKQEYARVMFVVSNKYKGYQKHLSLPIKLNNLFSKYYSGINKYLYFKNLRTYNQDLSPKVVLMELGSNKSTIAEIERTARVMAKIFALAIK